MFTHHISDVRCQGSGVTYHVSCVILKKLSGQSGGASRWRVCYKRGMPSLDILIYSLIYSNPLWNYPGEFVTPKPQELWTFCLSCVTSHVSHVMRHVSHVRCHMSLSFLNEKYGDFIFFFQYELTELIGEGCHLPITILIWNREVFMKRYIYCCISI